MNSSDLTLASALSRRLSGVVESPAAGSAKLEGNYVRFDTLAPRVTSRRSSSVPGAILADTQASPLEMESWEVFLAWAMEVCRARAAFVVDSQGFVIASRGNVPSGDFSGTGAELCFAMEQLASIDQASGTLKCVELQFEGYKLVGLRFPGVSAEQSFIVGFIGSRSLSDDLRALIARQLTFSLPGF